MDLDGIALLSAGPIAALLDDVFGVASVNADALDPELDGQVAGDAEGGGIGDLSVAGEAVEGEGRADFAQIEPGAADQRAIMQAGGIVSIAFGRPPGNRAGWGRSSLLP